MSLLMAALKKDRERLEAMSDAERAAHEAQVAARKAEARQKMVREEAELALQAEREIRGELSAAGFAWIREHGTRWAVPGKVRYYLNDIRAILEKSNIDITEERKGKILSLDDESHTRTAKALCCLYKIYFDALKGKLVAPWTDKKHGWIVDALLAALKKEAPANPPAESQDETETAGENKMAEQINPFWKTAQMLGFYVIDSGQEYGAVFLKQGDRFHILEVQDNCLRDVAGAWGADCTPDDFQSLEPDHKVDLSKISRGTTDEKKAYKRWGLYLVWQAANAAQRQIEAAPEPPYEDWQDDLPGNTFPEYLRYVWEMPSDEIYE